MGNEGIAKISPQEALNKADKMKTLASEVEGNLNKLKAKMQEINDEDAALYYGGKKPSALREELETEIATFANFKDQIDDFANIVTTTVHTMENE